MSEEEVEELVLELLNKNIDWENFTNYHPQTAFFIKSAMYELVDFFKYTSY